MTHTCSSTTVFILIHIEHQSIASFGHLFFFSRAFYLSTRFLSVAILESSVNYYILADQLVSEFLETISCAFLDAANAGYRE